MLRELEKSVEKGEMRDLKNWKFDEEERDG